VDGFSANEIQVGDARLFVRVGGAGDPLLLLHGFPQTHLMWRDVAPLLARRFTVICPDLRGYGQSSCPPSSPDHAPYAKRAFAQDLVALMSALGFDRFAVAGHDRGGRVAYRLALDHPQRVIRLAVLDVLPTEAAWERADERFALAFWPWSLLAQPEPLPERILQANAEAVVANALDAWGSPAAAFSPEVRAAYVQALRDPAHAHAICEEYRAASAIDREHDRADRAAGRRVACPTLVLWTAGGALDTWYDAEGGPLAIWHAWAQGVRGCALPGGHFFPESEPQATARMLHRFFDGRGEASTVA
jgi:haloacetate dehalogenase